MEFLNLHITDTENDIRGGVPCVTVFHTQCTHSSRPCLPADETVIAAEAGGYTLLHEAARSGDVSTLALLLDALSRKVRLRCS